jgi:RHS repeat-associated protein
MAWTTSYYHYDGLGSTRQLTDSDGNVTDTYTYDAWGESVASEGTTPNPFRWIGQVGYYYDMDTDEYHARERQYNPRVGRWLSQDPLHDSWNRFYHAQLRRFVSRDTLLYDDGENLYLYARANPVNSGDPAGLSVQPGVPSTGPGPWKPWPWQIDDEAEKRRGCTGNDCDHHCWAVCMTTHYTGCFVLPEITRFIQDVGEVFNWIPCDSECDILANEKGAKACAYNLSDPVKYCDKWCGTTKCR